MLRAGDQGWPQAYASVYAIVASLNPQLMTLAHDGAAALRDRYELVYRHEAAEPNALWQADHTPSWMSRSSTPTARWGARG